MISISVLLLQEDLLTKLLTSENIEEAVGDVKDMRAPTKYVHSYSMSLL